ncbi:hypothetical protein FOMPIDRAFT_1122802, partial [Fomitopsis schrenkii]
MNPTTSTVQNAPSEVASQHPIHRLPQETIDNIIAMLYGNRKSLKSCSLTCRSWHPTSHACFFHTVSFYRTTAVHLFAELLQCSPRVAVYVRTLCLRTVAAPSEEDLYTIVTTINGVQHLHI